MLESYARIVVLSSRYFDGGQKPGASLTLCRFGPWQGYWAWIRNCKSTRNILLSFCCFLFVGHCNGSHAHVQTKYIISSNYRRRVDVSRDRHANRCANFHAFPAEIKSDWISRCGWTPRGAGWIADLRQAHISCAGPTLQQSIVAEGRCGDGALPTWTKLMPTETINERSQSQLHLNKVDLGRALETHINFSLTAGPHGLVLLCLAPIYQGRQHSCR